MAWVRGKADAEGRIAEALRRVVDDLGEIGVQVAAYHGSELIADAGAGLADEGTGRSVGPDTVFNIFSITKAMIATALHMLAERGHIEYQAPVARYWPEFAANGKADALVIHALSHRIGLPEMPPGVTIERMCDWDDMVASIAAMAPSLPIGRKTPYHGYTFGWIVGELVRRADPQGRRVDRFVADEICAPLGIDGLWLGIPPHVNSRVAIMRDDMARTSAEMDPATLTPAKQVSLKAIPPSLRTTPENFGREDVRAACLPGMGAIADAKSVARFFAMLANGGEIDGVRLLSDERVRWCATPNDPISDDEFALDDRVISHSGFHLPVPVGGPSYYHALGRGSTVLAHAGSGGQLGFADLDDRLAVAILHNRMTSPIADRTRDPLVVLTDAIRSVAKIVPPSSGDRAAVVQA
jgi:CubicO group peptidase (beta-lactamase class C family)